MQPREYYTKSATFIQSLPEIKLDIFHFTHGNKPGLLIFKGKSNKPVVYVCFTNEQSREMKQKQTISNYTEWAEQSNKYRKEREQAKHNLKVGDILYNSWGYDMIIIDYYQVTAIRGSLFEIRELAQTTAEDKMGGCGRCMPKPNEFIDAPITKRSLKMEYGSLHVWDGNPKSYDHND